MYQYNEQTIEKIYAGWLGKTIGIRLGAPVEGWTYEKIQEVYGEIWDYPVDYGTFAADDDSNGPIFLVRAMEHGRKDGSLHAQDVADALLNYAPYEHGFFWWGGYGVSTEHTAYLNLRNGIKAPLCGSIAKNGAAIAEQIGGQIFIDPWGLISPGRPRQAAEFAKEVAGVTHDGNGIWGGVFVAVCISLAFEDYTVEEMLERALRFIPEECEYARAVKCVTEFYHKDEEKDWRKCYAYIREYFGYDRYPGYCHIIPNAAVMILSLLYGEDDYTKTICICNMCGWDTDCNVGNVGTIMGVRGGLEGIPYEKWRKPVNDLLICSGTMGSLNMMDLPYGASYMAKYAFETAGYKLPEKWKHIIGEHQESCHFEYPGSTHAMRVRCEDYEAAQHLEYYLTNSTEQAYTGSHSLKLHARPLWPGQQLYLFKKTYYSSRELHDDRYEPAFSPMIYPGQTLSGNVFLPDGQQAAEVRMYVRDLHGDCMLKGEKTLCRPGEWSHLEFRIPSCDGALLDEAGFCFTIPGQSFQGVEFHAYIDDMEYGGAPDYDIDFRKEILEMKTQTHHEITQFTKVKGWTWLEEEWLHITGTDFAETYTGSHRFEDYQVEARFRPLHGPQHYINIRVQGAMRSYAAGFHQPGRLALLKNENGYRTVAETAYPWEEGKEYRLTVRAKENTICILENGKELLSYTDPEAPYLTGAFGFSVQSGSHCSYAGIKVRGI